MYLTPENYHSLEAKQEYMSVSRYKTWIGSSGILACEARALAMEKGDWIEYPSMAMIASSYADAHFSETLDTFKAQANHIYKKGGDLRAEFNHMETIINRIERDPLMMMAMSGEKQVIITAEFLGLKWSIMIDSFDKEKFITDLKVMANFRKMHYVRDCGHMDFIKYYGYDLQLAIYQKIVELNTGKKLPCLIAVASKERPQPDIAVIGFDQSELDTPLSFCESGVRKIKSVRSGESIANRCEKCNYCKHTKILTEVVHISDLIGDI